MQESVEIAENAVRRNITRHQLTQAQFDALVSFTYNVGAGGARNVLRQVNAGNFQAAAAAAASMQQYIHATVYGPDGQPQRDENGHIVTRALPGLVNRRRHESAPFTRAAPE